MNARWTRALVALAAVLVTAAAPPPPEARVAVVGPYNAEFPAGGDGIAKAIPGYASGERLEASADWTIAAWIKPSRTAPERAVVASLGGAHDPGCRTLALTDGVPTLIAGSVVVRGGAPLAPGSWHYLAGVARGGLLTLFVDGRAIARSAYVQTASPLATVEIGPRVLGEPVFAGRIAGMEAMREALGTAELASRASHPPDEDLIGFENGSPTWPLQIRTQYGEAVPQRAWTLPKALSPPSRPVAIVPPFLPILVPLRPGGYAVNGWRMAEAPRVTSDGAAIARPGFDARGWYVATVPGTALTTLVDRGVYPDPRIGLNNLAIPDRLARQDYWYRTEFKLPATEAGKRIELLLNGVNYAAEVWVNGARVGTVRGAFIRGRFDIGSLAVPGQTTAVAIRVSPPPHPGLPHEQSILGGRGENGGAMMIDGPTFSATEGWDWIPTVRDRNTGLWQGVEIVATDALTLGDPAIVTRLPLADNSVAEIEIGVPVTNHALQPVSATLTAAFDDVRVATTVSIAPGATTRVTLRPAEHPELRVAHPRLWWPNGYGEAALHRLQLDVAADGRPSDMRALRFGIREIGYDLSAMDTAGDLRRVTFEPARAQGERVIDERHEAIRKVPGGWAPSLVPGAEHSPALQPAISDPRLSPHMILRVNGVPIAVRGGNMGMDELMKRVDRARLAPFFRLQREAHMNMVRNWMGQSTEEALYDLADENGIMIFNDFWESTQDNDAEAEDVPLFVANALDVVRRFGHHPSIVLWNGRNEGVPQPILQSALQDMVREADGTRLYTGNSRLVSFGGSGPYDWREPAEYFTGLARGFAVEVGTLSFPTLESWKRFIPAPDRWPLNDSWVYHDWHQTRAVSAKGFEAALAARFGAATDLEDFERKAQMLEYESHRAIFEGFNAGLWTTNSARMLWMSHPAWPSADFQIYSYDYDTHAAYYGTKKAAEPVHIQMNLPDHALALVNTTRVALTGIRVRARAVTLEGREVASLERVTEATANAVTAVAPFAIDAALTNGPLLIRLEARDASGALLSDNFYWQATDPAALRALNGLPRTPLSLSATAHVQGDETIATVTLANRLSVPALAAKLTAFGANGAQLLPAYFSDNYVSLLPGEERAVEIRVPGQRCGSTITIRGWNVAPAHVRADCADRPAR